MLQYCNPDCDAKHQINVFCGHLAATNAISRLKIWPPVSQSTLFEDQKWRIYALRSDILIAWRDASAVRVKKQMITSDPIITAPQCWMLYLLPACIAAPIRQEAVGNLNHAQLRLGNFSCSSRPRPQACTRPPQPPFISDKLYRSLFKHFAQMHRISKCVGRCGRFF